MMDDLYFEGDRGQTWFKWEGGSDNGKWVQTDAPEETKHILAYTPVG